MNPMSVDLLTGLATATLAQRNQELIRRRLAVARRILVEVTFAYTAGGVNMKEQSLRDSLQRLCRN
jgi:hypothetical protein